MDVGTDLSTTLPLLEPHDDVSAAPLEIACSGRAVGARDSRRGTASKSDQYSRLEGDIPESVDEADVQGSLRENIVTCPEISPRSARACEGAGAAASSSEGGVGIQFYECEEVDEEAAILGRRNPASSVTLVPACPNPYPVVPEKVTVNSAPTSPRLFPATASAANAAAAALAAAATAMVRAVHAPGEVMSSAREMRVRSSQSGHSCLPNSMATDGLHGDGEIAIEMRNFEHPEQEESGDAELGQSTGASSDATLSLSAATPRGRGSGNRQCFICLQEHDKDNRLVPCCTTCYACTHVRCWREWRNNQRITTLRSRLLGLRMQADNLLLCSICKSGTAMVRGEEDGLEWMNELFCRTSGGVDDRMIQLARRQNDSNDELESNYYNDFMESRTWWTVGVYIIFFVFVLSVSVTVAITQHFYAGDVALCCVIAIYELSVLHIVALVVTRRRAADQSIQADSGAAATDRLPTTVP
eukprot:TRINITY_DN6825_c0_g1_i1.p1 TRINITY_DN6825_c0_g1~~TRINITY_DN6825_c0_g1_i1.p1  ORF type:complete len:472 (-),score=61.72 TRINITY_DN6825_c0_g1_i1:34-1449(-)